VRSVTEDNDVQSAEAFLRQVVDRIQGDIEAKLTPSPPTPISVLSPAYSGVSYQAPTFYTSHYTNISPPQLSYTAAALQPSTAAQRNVGKVDSNLLQPTLNLQLESMTHIGNVGLVVQNNRFH